MRRISPKWPAISRRPSRTAGKSDSVAFVIDDRVDVVWQARDKGIKVDGVHIGQTDMEPQEARALLGEDASRRPVRRDRKVW